MSEAGVLYSSSKRAAAIGWGRYQNLLWESCNLEATNSMKESQCSSSERKVDNYEKQCGNTNHLSTVSENEPLSNITNVFTTAKAEAQPPTSQRTAAVESERYKRIWNTTNLFKSQLVTSARTPVEGSWRYRSAIPFTARRSGSYHPTSTRRSVAVFKENKSPSNIANNSFVKVQTKAQFPTSQRAPVEASWRNRGPRKENNPSSTAEVLTSERPVLNPTSPFTMTRTEKCQRTTATRFCPLQSLSPETNSYPTCLSVCEGKRRLSPKAKPFTPASQRKTVVNSDRLEEMKRRLWNQLPEIISSAKGYRPFNMPTYPQYDQGYDTSKIKTPFTGSPVHIKAAWALAHMHPTNLYENGESFEIIFEVYKGFVYDMQKKPGTYQMFLQTVAHLYDQFNKRVKVNISDLIRYLPDRIWYTNFAMADSNLLQVIKRYYQKYPVGP